MSKELKGEAVEVVAWMWRDINGDMQFNYMHPEGEELMTVVQHQRLMAAKDAEIVQLEEQKANWVKWCKQLDAQHSAPEDRRVVLPKTELYQCQNEEDGRVVYLPYKPQGPWQYTEFVRRDEVSRLNPAPAEQQPAAVVPDGWNIQLVFNPSGYKIQMPSGGFIRTTDHGGGGVETAFCKFVSAVLAAAPAPVQQATLTNVRCQCCANEYVSDSYEAGFIDGSGMCQACDSALPAKDIPQKVEHPYPEGTVEALERTDWTPTEALRWYAEGRHFDVVDGRTRIIDTGAIASNALKHADLSYLELKGDAELSELRQRVAQQAEQKPVATILPPDPYDERDGIWISADDLRAIAALPAGTKLYTAPQPSPDQDVAGLKLEGLKVVHHQMGMVCLGFKKSEQTQAAVRELRAALAAHDKQSGEVKS